MELRSLWSSKDTQSCISHSLEGIKKEATTFAIDRERRDGTCIEETLQFPRMSSYSHRLGQEGVLVDFVAIEIT